MIFGSEYFNTVTYFNNSNSTFNLRSQGGRIFEVQNPFATTTAEAKVRWLSKIPGTAHEGLRFDRRGVLYFVDEYTSGCLYKYVPKVKTNICAPSNCIHRRCEIELERTAIFSENWSSNMGANYRYQWC